MLKILFLGDISARLGRETIKQILPKLKKEYKPDLVIANAENAAHGSGATAKTIEELMAAGIDWFTSGDHAFDREKEAAIFEKYNILRPANYPSACPGRGWAIAEKNGKKILLINLIGRVFMSMDYDCPFKKLDEILAQINLDKEKISAIIIDIHAEATAEKNALKHYADGRASAVIGTHTHVITGDQEITDKGTAYLTDAGMVGFSGGCIGVGKEGIIKTFLTQIRTQHEHPESGQTVLNGALLHIGEGRKAKKIKTIIKNTYIK